MLSNLTAYLCSVISSHGCMFMVCDKSQYDCSTKRGSEIVEHMALWIGH